MADYKTLIKDKKTQNWLKASIAINITKDGLSDFVNDIAGQLQKKILADVQKNNQLPVSATCNTCRTGNVFKCTSTKKCPNTCNLHKDTSITFKVCPNLICHNFAPELSKYHRFHKPSWKNTESTKWCTSAWEIAKCYHPPDGYLDKADASVTDFNGVVSVIINCEEFDNHVTENLADKKNIFVQSRDVVKNIRHSATLQVEDADLQDAFTAMKAILSDAKTLSGNTQAQEAMKILLSLEADTLTITIEDVVKLIQDTLNDTQTVISEASCVSEEAKRTNEETKDLQSKLELLNKKEEELKKLVEETKAATEKIKIAAQVEESRVNKAGQMEEIRVNKAGQMMESRVKEAGEKEESRVQKAGEKEESRVQKAGEKEESRVKRAVQMVESNVKNAGQMEERSVKKAGQMEVSRAKKAGQMEESRVKKAVQMVETRVKKAVQMAESRVKVAGQKEESHVKNAGQMEECRVKKAGQMEESRVKKASQKEESRVKKAGENEESRVKKAGHTVKRDLEKASEHITKAATEKIKLVGQTEESHVKDAGQMEESRVKDAGQKEENRVKDAGQMEESRVKDTGQKEESRVKDAGKMVKQDLEKVSEHVTKAVTEKIKIAGETEESHVKDAGQMEESRVKDAGQKEENRVKETGKRVKLDVEFTGEHIAKKIKLSGQMEENHIKETGQMVKQDVQLAGENETKKIKTAGQMAESTMKKIGQRVKQAMKKQQNKSEDEIYEERKHELQQALAYHYWTKHDSMPLSPLMPDIDDKLTKFYIGLKMNKMDTKLSIKPVQTRDSVNTYKALFYNDSNILHRNIYIQGEAGKGKTTFCTKLGLVWSETNLPMKDSSVNKSTIKLKQSQVFSDESIISKFDFVFSLALRNVKSECEIERMIETQIISGLPDCTKYAGLVPTILDKERCLISLDGLDEWSHRSDLCDKSEHVPHRKSWSNTAVLTSTRPWKMNELRLRDSEISTLIQITGITDSGTFTKNVLNCLNEKSSTTHKLTDFLRDMRVKKLEHFLDIPVVAMQLLCLWHSGHELGNSKCKIYLNMLDMLFGRAQEKSPACDDIDDSLKVGLPPCLESSMFCKQHKMLLDSLGSLSFHTLYSYKREEALVFSDSIVKSHVKSTAALKTALTTGILSQHKSPSLLEKRSHFSFLHKTFQEFLAAYYIATHADESENIVQTLFQVYGQTFDIMDNSELFIFVCGLNTEMSCKISDSVMKSFSVKLTNHIEEFHVSGGNYDVADMTHSLQEMLLAGYKESISNGHQDPQLALHHVYYKDISGDDKIYRDRMVDRNIDKIVTLSAVSCTVDVVKIQQILTQSSSTLSHVSLLMVEGLTDASLDLFTNITLKSLHLDDINTQLDIKLNTSSLLYCHLGWINKEVEHSVLSALTTAPKLHTLGVGRCENMSVLCQVLPTLPMLHTLHVRERIPASLCQVMSTLSQLQRLTVRGGRCEDPSLLCQAPSTLSNLQYIKLGSTLYTDLGDNDILLPNSIQEIVLHFVKLTCRSFRQLVDRLTQIPHKVTCRLYCTVRPGEEWDAIVKHIQQSHMFEIHQNDMDSYGSIYLHFNKIQT